MKIKKVIFMGTPEFGVPTLAKLAETRFRPILCITQPDRPKGRKRRLQPTEVKIKALELGIPVIQPEDVNAPEVLEQIRALEPDVIVTVAYGGYLKKEIRKVARFGAINLHPSLLPLHRGSAPMNFTLFSGDEVTGNTIFKIVAKMDAGPIILQKKYDVQQNECFTSLYNRLSQTGADDVLESLELLENGIELQKQNHDLASFTSKIEKEDTFISFDMKAKELQNKVRGLAEVPGAVASFRDARIKIIELEILEDTSSGEAGSVSEFIKNKGLVLNCSDRKVLVTKVQPAGKKVMTAHAFQMGAQVKNGEKFGNGF